MSLLFYQTITAVTGYLLRKKKKAKKTKKGDRKHWVLLDMGPRFSYITCSLGKGRKQ